MYTVYATELDSFIITQNEKVLRINGNIFQDNVLLLVVEFMDNNFVPEELLIEDISFFNPIEILKFDGRQELKEHFIEYFV